MPKTSAGLLLYRRIGDKLEVFLVHPGGPFWAKKDAAAWSIAKGEVAAGEELLTAARREFAEETGLQLDSSDADFIALSPLKQRNGKIVYAFALEVRQELDIENIRSNTFTLEWPPRSGKQQEFPEIDRAAWFPLDIAAEKIHVGQRGLLEELQQLVQR